MEAQVSAYVGIMEKTRYGIITSNNATIITSHMYNIRYFKNFITSMFYLQEQLVFLPAQIFCTNWNTNAHQIFA